MSLRVRVVRGALALAFAASVAFGVTAYRQAIDGARRAAEIRLDPLGLEHPDFPAPSRRSVESPVVVLLGDSRAYRWPYPGRDHDFAFVNRGIPDQATAQILGRFDAQMATTAAMTVVIQAGINDLKAIPLVPERRDEIVASCKANLHALVAKSRALQAFVVVTTLFPLGPVPLERRPVWSDAVATAVLEVNDDLRGLAGEGVRVVDAFQLLADERGHLRSEYVLDTLHLNERGYAVLNAALVPVVQALWTSRSE